MKKSNIILGVFILSIFSSCQKEDEYIIEEQEELNLIDLPEIDQMTTTLLNAGLTNQNDAEGEMVFESEEIRLNRGRYYTISIPKSTLLENQRCSYLAKVNRTIDFGNPDLGIFAFSENQNDYRLIRSSKLFGNQVEESYGEFDDLTEDESHITIAIKAQSNTQFILKLFKECLEGSSNPATAFFGAVLESSFSTSAYDVETTFKTGDNLYINAVSPQPENIEKITLFVNGVKVKDEFQAPYEWGMPIYSSHSPLNNMQAGRYQLLLRTKGKNGVNTETKQQIEVVDYCIIDFKSIVNRQEGSVQSEIIRTTLMEGDNAYISAELDTSMEIEHIRLEINGRFVREEFAAPYEWGKQNNNQDTLLNDLQKGTYILKLIAYSTNGQLQAVSSKQLIVL